MLYCVPKALVGNCWGFFILFLKGDLKLLIVVLKCLDPPTTIFGCSLHDLNHKTNPGICMSYPKSVLLVLIIILTGCVSIPESAAPQKLEPIKTVGIISLVAKNIHHKFVGFTVFGNYYYKTDISNWNLDTIYENQIADVLEELGLFEVTQLTYDRDALNVLNSTISSISGRLDWEIIENELIELSSSSSVDAFIILGERTTPDYFTKTNQWLQGTGLYTSDAISDFPPPYVAHIISWLALVDGKTGKPIAIKAIQVDKDIEKSLLSRSYTYNEKAEKKVKEFFASLPGREWWFSLRELFGIDK